MIFLSLFNKQKYFLIEKSIFSQLSGIISRKGFLLLGFKKLVEALSIFKRETGIFPLKFLNDFVDDFRPQVGQRSKKVAGMLLKIPIILGEKRSKAIFSSWFVKSAFAELGSGSEKRLANEFVLASFLEGNVLKNLKELYDEVLLNEPNLRFLRKRRRRRRLRRKYYYKRKFFRRIRRIVFWR